MTGIAQPIVYYCTSPYVNFDEVMCIGSNLITK